MSIFFYLILALQIKCFSLNEFFGNIPYETIVSGHSIEEWNSGTSDVFPLFKQLENSTFFKLYKFDLNANCPYWYVQEVCSIDGGSCGICPCDEEDIPLDWQRSSIDQNTPLELFQNPFQKSVHWEEEECEEWNPTPCEEDMTYINLHLNPHANTGYAGKRAGKIWDMIYRENCFRDGESVDDLCFEEKLFFKAISGIHQSITMALITYFKKIQKFNVYTGEEVKKEFVEYDDFTPNLDFFAQRVLPFHDRIENLYFVYSFMIDAFQRGKPFFESEKYLVGNTKEDAFVSNVLKELFEKMNDDFTPVLIEEDQYHSLKSNMGKLREKFYNISRIMDCIECEKCKLWAKLEMSGLSVAFRILLSEEKDLDSLFESIHRNEIIAFFNTLSQLSRSIENYNRLVKMNWRRKVSPILAFVVMGVIASIMILAITKIIMKWKGRNDNEKKKNKKKE